MKASWLLRSIHVRLATLIILAMTALVVLLIYQQVQRHNDDKRRGDENLQRLATFAAYAEREQFDAAERLLVLAAQSGQTLRTVAAQPDSQEAFDRCTSALFVLDRLLPETSGFALWDTNGNSLCSSEAAKRGEYNVTDRLWFQTVRERGAFATGGFELSPPDEEPSIAFGIPIKDPSGAVVAYLSTGLRIDQADDRLAGVNLPETGRIGFVDQNGTIINSTVGRSGEHVENYERLYAGLDNFGEAITRNGTDGRRVAAVRVTDADDSKVVVVIGADKDVLAPPLATTLPGDLAPVAVLTLLTLAAVWFLAQRWVGRPVEALVSASDRLAKGDLGARADMPPGIFELEKLGSAFNAMADTRERASEAKDEFLGLVSHELRTPITTVLGNAEILRYRNDRLDDEMRKAAIEDIHDGAQRLVAIIDNLLALARLDRGAELESEPLALAHLAEAAADEQLTRTPGRSVLVRGDRTLLALGGQTYVEQVLRNLIGNAIKYSPPDDQVEVHVDEGAGMAVVRVLDRGPGVARNEQEAIFTPFYRSARTAATAEGIGIGLSVCKRLIDALGGSIWCAERDGGGCEFGFSLPLVAEDPPVVAASPEEPIAAVAS